MHDDLRGALLPKLASSELAEDTDVDMLVARYRSECAERSEHARQASDRPALEAALNDRRTSETAALKAAATRLAARTRLTSAAVDCNLRPEASFNIADEDADQLVDEFEAWLKDQRSQAESAELERSEWNELVTLLGGAELHDVECAFDALVSAHQVAIDSVSTRDATVREQKGELDSMVLPAELPPSTPLEVAQLAEVLDLLSERRAETDRVSKDLRAAVDNASGVVDERSRTLVSVAEADEQLVATQTELVRVQDLEAVLDATIGFLAQARDRAHRSIAPVLEDRAGFIGRGHRWPVL